MAKTSKTITDAATGKQIIITQEVVECPRCKRNTIETRDWGKSGILFVHSFGIVNGMPCKDACHVPMDELQGGLNWSLDLRDNA
jgi:hypothetical protein